MVERPATLCRAKAKRGVIKFDQLLDRADARLLAHATDYLTQPQTIGEIQIASLRRVHGDQAMFHEKPLLICRACVD